MPPDGYILMSRSLLQLRKAVKAPRDRGPLKNQKRTFD